MNGSTEVRSASSSSSSSRGSMSTAGKTDTPLPIGKSVRDSAGTTRPVRSGERIISGIDLVDYGAGGLMPNHVYLVKGGGGVGKSIVGLQFLVRGLEHQEPGVLIT